MSTPELPPPPPGWNKTTADLFIELQSGQRAAVGWPEAEWALEYERSLLPPGTRFPREGDVFSANAPFPATLLIGWRSPVTTDVRYTLPAGTRVRVESASLDRPLTVYAVPADYKSVEKAAIRLWTRLRPDYGGYRLALHTRDLNSAFTLVASGA